MPTHPQQDRDLSQLIIQQFMLHEVEHHDLAPGPDADSGRRVPMAHDMIDIYKCLHQGEFGVGHTIDDPDRFKQRLYQEMLSDPSRSPIHEPAVESVAADERMLRVNLRGLRAVFSSDVAGAVDHLARACMESASITAGDHERFFESLDRFKMLNQVGAITVAGFVFAFPDEVVERFFFEVHRLMRQIRQVPVFGHSDGYKRLNRPSYRVVERSVLEVSPLRVLLEGRS